MTKKNPKNGFPAEKNLHNASQRKRVNNSKIIEKVKLIIKKRPADSLAIIRGWLQENKNH